MVLLLAPFTPVAAQPCSSPPADESAADLDLFFGLHDYVFVARVDRVERRGVLADTDVTEHAELFVYRPTLKGAVPDGPLRFDRNAPCAAQFAEGAVYLLFLNDLEGTPVMSEVRLAMASTEGPAVAGLLEWIRDQSNAREAADADLPPIASASELRWNYRLLLIDAERADVSLADLAAAEDAMRERDLLWFARFKGELRSNYAGEISASLEADLLERIRDRTVAVALIGKDGGLKLGVDSLELESLLTRIDAMPMRRQEIRDSAR
jgi:hypothetical protein